MDLAAILVSGWLTVYGPPLDTHIQNRSPVYCDRGYGWTYGSLTVPFVALDVGMYESGAARCGDELLIYPARGDPFYALALDAGNLAEFGIVADIPLRWASFDDGRMAGQILNLSALDRFKEQMQ